MSTEGEKAELEAPESALPPELAAESADTHLGESPATQAANKALLALARAARSFLIYDARNDAIRGFLEEWQRCMADFTGRFGEMDLEVRPFELVYDGQVVYLERDRERSLAFRLFRDGVRRLTISAGITWDEQLRLLEILSIRYTGIRQQEDDIVTLLWKAGFENVKIEAVEGIVLDQGEDDGGLQRGKGMRMDAPSDRDHPLPRLLNGKVSWRVLPVEETIALRAGEESGHLGAHCLSLVRRLLEAVKDPTDPAQASEMAHLIEEIREFMLGEQQLDTLLELLELLDDGLPPDLSGPMIRGFASPRALRRIVRSVQHSHSRPPDALFELLERVPGEHLHTIADALARDRDPDSRRINRQLAESMGKAQPQTLMRLVLDAPPESVTDLFRAAHNGIPEHCLEHCVALAERGDSELQAEIMRYLQDDSIQGDTLPTLLSLAQGENLELRLKALEMLGHHRDPRVYPFLMSRVEEGVQTLDPKESDAVGHALAAQEPDKAGAMFLEWVRPSGLLGRFFGGTTPTQIRQQWVALAGLEVLPHVAAEDSVKWLQKRAGADLARRCQGCLVRRRKAKEGRDG